MVVSGMTNTLWLKLLSFKKVLNAISFPLFREIERL